MRCIYVLHREGKGEWTMATRAEDATHRHEVWPGLMDATAKGGEGRREKREARGERREATSERQVPLVPAKKEILNLDRDHTG